MWHISRNLSKKNRRPFDRSGPRLGVIEIMESRVLLSANVLATWSQDTGDPIPYSSSYSAPGPVATFDQNSGDVLVASAIFPHGPPLEYIVVGAFSPNGNGSPDTILEEL
jgi:hypothetical protein